MKKEKVRLDRDAVVSTALRLIDAQGLESLTIRHLASELGVTPMALYWHFSDKQALLDGLVDQLWADALARIDSQPAEEDRWSEMRRVVLALVETFSLHPTIAMLAPLRVISCEPGLIITERTLESLHEIGLSPAQSADIARFVLSSAIMLVSNQPGAMFPDVEMREEMARVKRGALGALSPDRYPRTIEAAEFLTNCDEPAQYYAAGVDIILGGIISQAQLAHH